MDGLYAPRVLFLWALCQTGGRRAETALLTWDDIDLEAGRIHFRADTVPVEELFLSRLKAYRLTLPVGTRLAFPNTGRTATWKNTKAFNEWLDRVLEAGDIEKETAEGVVDTHALRHTYITRLLRAGMSAEMVAKLSGHSNVAHVTRIYSHLKLVDVEAVALEALRGFRQKSGNRSGLTTDESYDGTHGRRR